MDGRERKVVRVSSVYVHDVILYFGRRELSPCVSHPPPDDRSDKPKCARLAAAVLALNEPTNTATTIPATTDARKSADAPSPICLPTYKAAPAAATGRFPYKELNVRVKEHCRRVEVPTHPEHRNACRGHERLHRRREARGSQSTTATTAW